jgi:uncharacterized protein (TIGR03435 family)
MFRAAWFAILSASAVCGQQAQQQPRFEVASIKPGGDIFSTKPQWSPGRLTWTTQLAYLIGYAYELDFARVSGQGLGAIYTINAVFEPKTTEGELRLMLQSLLADRFAMRFQRLVKEVDGYGVSIGRGGNKMKEAFSVDQPGPGDVRSAPSSPFNESYVFATEPSPGVTAITGRGASLSQLIQTLGRIVGMPLWDQTGLEGKYDFAFRFSEDSGTDSQTDAPSLSTALRDSLGLTIKKQRGPLETLVIDHLAQPSEN